MADDTSSDGAPFRTLSYAEIKKRALAQGYSEAGADGIAQNFMRESGGKTATPGDKGTSEGLAQWHLDRKDALEAFAREKGKDWRNPDLQFDFFDHEMRTQYPKLRSQLMTETDSSTAENAFKRIYERPKSVMWATKPDGGPALGTPRYRFSDYAMSEHDGRRNTSIVYMDPGDYLALSPDLEDEPFTSRSGKALRKSFEAGDEIEAIPSLDLKVNGSTGTVTDQDGRHRALLAQEEGVDAIPVAIKQTGKGEPTEIEGMAGRVLPNNFQPASAVKRETKPDGSVFGRIMDQIVPKAEAAEDWWDKDTPVQAPTAAAGGAGNWWDRDTPVQGHAGAGGVPAAPGAPALAMGSNPMATHPAAALDPAAALETLNKAMMAPIEPLIRGAATGIGRTALGAGQLLGKGMEATGIPGGEWLAGASRRGNEMLTEAAAPDMAAHPILTGIGEIAGGSVVPGGIAARAGGGLVRMSALGGGIAGLLQPTDSDRYWTKKAVDVPAGIGLGIAGGAAGYGAAKLGEKAVTSVVQPLVRWLTGVAGPKVPETPAVKEVLRRIAQDAKVGGPTAQDMLDLANATPHKPMAIADLGGENTLNLAGRMARSPGESRQIMSETLNQRDLEAGSRLVADIDSGIAGGSAYDAATALSHARAVGAAPKYEAAFKIEPDIAQVRPIQRFITDPIGQEALHAGMRVMEIESLTSGKGFMPEQYGVVRSQQTGKWIIDPTKADKPSMRLLDSVKRGYDEIVEGFRDPTSGRLNLNQYGRAVNDARAKYTGYLRQTFPAYNDALNSWAGPSQSLGALKAGQDFLRQRPEEIARHITSLSPGDREFYKLGAADTLRNAVAKKGPEADEAKAILRSQYMRDQLRPLFDTPEAYDRFVNSVSAEARMFGTRYNVLKGSQTAARMSEDQAPGMEALGHAAHGSVNALHGNYLASALNYLRAGNALRKAPDQVLNAEIARMLTRPVHEPGSAGRNLLVNFGQYLPNVRGYFVNAQGAAPWLGAASAETRQ